MPTTTYTNTTFSVAAIGNRTDSAGAAVDDFTAEEARFVAEILNGGYLKPAEAYQVTEQDTPNMTVRVGSGTAKADFYVVEGQVGGQGNYIVRLDATSVTLTVPAADASQARTDEVYLVVRDNAYDASARGLPTLGYRRGDVGGSAPGPDGAWEAYALLATVAVTAAETAIEAASITDERSVATLVDGVAVDTSDLILKEIVNAKGDLIVGTAADAVTRLAVGADGQVLVADSGEASGINWGPGFVLEAATDSAAGEDTTTANTFSDVSAAGGSNAVVTVDVGPSGVAIVFLSSQKVSTATTGTYVGFRLSGENTRAASVTAALKIHNSAATLTTYSKTVVASGLTPGETTFTAQVRALTAGQTAGVDDPEISVLTF